MNNLCANVSEMCVQIWGEIRPQIFTQPKWMIQLTISISYFEFYDYRSREKENNNKFRIIKMCW